MTYNLDLVVKNDISNFLRYFYKRSSSILFQKNFVEFVN
jgi:hypothetical protein